MLNKTKIIATIGPSTNHSYLISKMIKNGMNVARLNMAHQRSAEETEKLVKMIRVEAKKNDRHVAIIMDIAGPKIRVDLSNIGDEEIKINKDHVYSLGFSKMNDIPINMEIEFNNTIGKNALVKIDDGKIKFKTNKLDCGSNKLIYCNISYVI